MDVFGQIEVKSGFAIPAEYRTMAFRKVLRAGAYAGQYPVTDRDILIGSRSWSSTPWDYSSTRFLQFAEDGTGVAIYGYGQTIYAKINFTFTLADGCRLRMSYLESPAYQRFSGFAPTDDNRHNDLVYALSDDQQVITESITAHEFRFEWQLRLDRSPFPSGLSFPYEVPLLYFGYRAEVVAEDPQ